MLEQVLDSKKLGQAQP